MGVVAQKQHQQHFCSDLIQAVEEKLLPNHRNSLRYRCKKGRMKTLFFLLLSDTVWMYSLDRWCNDDNNYDLTKVTWYCRQENGKLTYQPSLESCYVHSKDMSSNIGASLTRIRAKVADEAWAGTDCAVKLILRNRDEPFTCETMALDGAGDNWERDQVEDFKEEDFREEFLPCKHFFPKPGKLQFQFTCSDSMKLAHVELDFGTF